MGIEKDLMRERKIGTANAISRTVSNGAKEWLASILLARST
jgi:hypothetical protein